MTWPASACLALPGVNSRVAKLRFSRNGTEFLAWACVSKIIAPGLETAVASLLGPRETDHYNRIRFTSHRHSFLLGRLCAKRAIEARAQKSRILGMEILPGAAGQPIVFGDDAGNSQVTISHSGSLSIAIAFDEGFPLGVDLEEIDPRNTSAIEELLRPAEKSLLESLNMDRASRATLAWTAKEALAKALKSGIAASLPAYEFKERKIEPEVVRFEFKQFPQHEAIAFPARNFAFSIALPAQTKTADFPRNLVQCLNLEDSGFSSL